MRSTRIFALVILALSVATAAFGAEYRQGEVIVKYKDGVVRTRSTMNALYDAAGVKSVRRYSGLMQGLEQLILQDNIKVQDAIAALEKSDAVEYAQPNYLLYALPIHQADGNGGLPCIPGLNIPGCSDNGGGGNGGGGSIPCIPGMNIPGCSDNGGGGNGGGLPIPGGNNGGGGSMPCLFPGIQFPPGCTDSGNNPNPNPQPQPQPDPGNNPPSNPASGRPALQPAPAEVIPPVADPDLDQAYGLSKIGATQAWNIWKGSKDFIVADIDTGIDYNHEDLSFNLWRNPNPGPKNDVVGYDFVHDDGLPYDDNEHGTHTAGTIGAVGGNGKGVSGVAQRVSIMALKFISSDGSGTTADAIKAIDYAINHGARVLSNSWGGKGDDTNQALQDAITRAEQKGVLFVAAAGNDGTDNDGNDPDYPAAFKLPNILSVAATDESDGLAFFSNYGKTTTHLAAPGTNVYSTVPGGKYAKLSGTSMACPHAAGAAALLWSKHPQWDYKKVKQVLMDSTDKLQVLDGKTVTGGRLNVLNALRSTE